MPCDLCADLTEAEARDNGARSYNLAVSTLRAQLALAQRADDPSAGKFRETERLRNSAVMLSAAGSEPRDPPGSVNSRAESDPGAPLSIVR